MKISKLIAHLEELKEFQGDSHILLIYPTKDLFTIKDSSSSFVADMIGYPMHMPNEDESLQKMAYIVLEKI